MIRVYNYPLERLLVRALIATLLLLACLYVYLLCASILNVVMREEMVKDIAALNSSIGELESSYLSQKDALDVSEVSALGFEKIADKRFVERYSLVARGLTLNH